MSVLASICTFAARTINNPPSSVEAGFYLRLATDLGSFYGIAIIQRRIGVGPNHKFQQVALRKGEPRRGIDCVLCDFTLLRCDLLS